MSSGHAVADHGHDTALLVHQEEEEEERRPRPDGGQLERAAAGDGADVDADAGESFSWPTIIGFLFLTFSSGMAVYRSEGDPWAIAFVVFSYSNLVALFACLRMYESADEGSPRRDHLKIAIWLLTTLLTATFSHKVAAVMPLPVAMLVYAMAFLTVAGGYYAFFLYSEK